MKKFILILALLIGGNISAEPRDRTVDGFHTQREIEEMRRDAEAARQAELGAIRSSNRQERYNHGRLKNIISAEITADFCYEYFSILKNMDSSAQDGLFLRRVDLLTYFCPKLRPKIEKEWSKRIHSNTVRVAMDCFAGVANGDTKSKTCKAFDLTQNLKCEVIDASHSHSNHNGTRDSTTQRCHNPSAHGCNCWFGISFKYHGIEGEQILGANSPKYSTSQGCVSGNPDEDGKFQRAIRQVANAYVTACFTAMEKDLSQ